MTDMQIERLQDLSMYYYIRQIMDDIGASFVNVVDDYPDENLTLPTISIVGSDITTRPFELGNRKGHDVRIWFIEIFATNKSQRDDYAYLIKNKLMLGVPVYDYNEGFPPPTPTQLGSMSCDEISTKPIKVFAELVSTVYWRRQIKVIAYYNKAPA